MALGVGVLFPPGSDGRPTALYVADLQASCVACGLELTKRYFLSTRFHALTLVQLEQRMLSLPAAIEGACAQCDEPLAAEGVERWALQISPGDGEGLLHGLCDTSGEPEWRWYPHDFLDVQGLPRLTMPEDISSVALDALTEPSFHAASGRYWNPKSALRRAILADDEDLDDLPGALLEDEGAVVLDAAPGLRFWIGVPEDAPFALKALRDAGWAVSVLVDDGVPCDAYPDAARYWITDLEPHLFDTSVVAAAHPDAADAALRRHFERFPVDLRFERDDDVLRVIAGDGDSPSSRLDFPLDAICDEAARTGAAPGDIARIEIDRALTLLDMTASRA